jgi:flagellar hook assembly protein FlgD
MPDAGHVSLTIYNMMGQEVRRLVDREQGAGYYTVAWEGKDERDNSVQSGIYLCRIKTEKYSSMKKLVLVK